MESHCCATAASDHSESMAGSHEQHCSQMPQQMMFNTPSQGHPHRLSGHSHVLPQQSRMVIPQQYISAEQNMHYGQAQRTLADHPPVCSALTGEASLHGQQMSSVQPNTLTYSEVKSHQRHSSSQEPAPVFGSMSGPVMSMPGHVVHHSPKAVQQNIEGMIVSGHIPGGDGHMRHGGCYPVPHHGQHIQNSGQISWQNQRQYMSPEGQVAVPEQTFVSGVQARFNSQVSVPFRGQHPHPQYALNQEYGDIYCQQYRPVYGELNSGSPRGTFPPQQHCVGPNEQRIMFARHSMHAPRHHHHMPADAQFVYYAPHSVSGASQQLSPSWSGPTQMMRSGVPLGYGNQPAWHRPTMAAAYGSPLPGQHMPDYHLSPEPRMTAEFYDNFGGARQRASPSHSFSPGSVHCYRQPSKQGVHTGMMYVDEKYVGSHHVLADGNPNSTSASQEYVSPVLTSTNASTSTMCSTAGSDASSKDNNVLTHTTAPSHPLEHLPDGRTSTLSHSSCVSGTAASSLSSYNHAGYYLHGTNVNGPWPVSAAGEYYSYNAASQYSQHHQHTANPYNYYASPPHVPYSGTPHYASARCRHPYHAEGMQWQGQVAEHPLHEHRNILPDKVASQHHVERESLTTVSITTWCGSVSVTCSALRVSSSVFSTSAPVTSWKVDKQNLDNADEVNITRTVPVQSTGTYTQMPFSGLAHPVKEHNTVCSSVARSLNCSPISQVVATATGTMVTLPASAVDFTSMIPLNNAIVPPMNKDVLVRDKHSENVLAVSSETESQNCLQITSSALSSTCKSPKGPKRSGSRKGTKKTKKKKADLSLDTNEFCIDGVIVSHGDAVECNAIESLYSTALNISTSTPVKTTLGTESVDYHCPVSSHSSEQTAIVVPYGWRRQVDNGTVIYYRLHSLILLMLNVDSAVLFLSCSTTSSNFR